MKRPTDWKANPQAMAAVSTRKAFDNPLGLSVIVDADTWLTPQYILSQLGEFDLDPCAAECSPGHVCENSYTVADDGLVQPWRGRVFMNPPFSNTVPWLRKHAEHGTGISLVPVSVESIVWRSYVWKRAIAILLLHGRTRFCNPDGSATTGRPLRSVALIAWSPADAAVLRCCSLAGVYLNGWEQR